MAINQVPPSNQTTTTTGIGGQSTSTATATGTPSNTSDILSQLELAYRSRQLLNGSDSTSQLEALRGLLFNGNLGSAVGSGPTTEPAPSDPRLNGLYEAARIAENVAAEADTASAAAIAGYSQTLPSFEDLAGDKGDFEEALAQAQAALTAANGNLALILPGSPAREQAEAYVARVEEAIDRIKALGEQTYSAALSALDNVTASPVEIRDQKSFLTPVNGRVVIQGDDGRQDLRFRNDGGNIYFDRDGQRFYIDPNEAQDIIVNLKGGDDRVVAYEIDIPGVHFLINGGGGRDFIQASRSGDWIIGGAGADEIYTEGAHAAQEGEEGEYDFVDVRDGGEDRVFNGGTAGWGRLAGTTEVIGDETDKVNEGDRNDNNPRRAKTTVNGQQQEQIAPPPTNRDDFDYGGD